MIHERAVVDPSARLAEDVEVGPFAVIGPDVEIDSGTVIGPHVVIHGPTRIGRGNRIHQFCAIGEGPQDTGYSGEATRLEIGDNNTFREFCTVNRATTKEDWVTRVGSNNWIMAYVHIAHDCKVGDHAIMANAATLAGHVEVGDHVVLGGFSKVHQFCRVGEHAFCGMDTGIKGDVPPYLMVSGIPARPKGLNAVGLRRRGFDRDTIRALRSVYRTLYRSGLRLEEAMERLDEEGSTVPEVARMRDFIRGTRRSIVR